MDFLNKSMQQIGDLLKAMSPAARMTAGLLLAVVVISLVYLFRYQGTSPNNYLLAARSFSSSELAAMEAAFSQADLNDYEIEGSKVRVPLSQRAAYLAALAEYGALPQNFDSVLADALSSNSPFESQTARTQRIQYAKQRELSRVISSMNGIENASVYYDEITERGLRGQRKFTAAVSVQPVGSGSLDGKLVDSIRKFVAASQAGMQPGDVTVTDLISGRTYSMPTDSTSQLAAQYAEQKLRFEQDWQDKIARVLSYINGVEFAVNVELDGTLERQSYNLSADPKVTPMMSDESSSVERVVRGAGGGQPGVVPNVGGSNTSQSLGSTQDTRDIENRQGSQINFPSFGQDFERTAPLTPENVTVSVAVPTSYYEDLWRKNNPAVPGEEQVLPEDGALQQLEQDVKTQVQEQIVALLPSVTGGENGYPRVVVTSFTRITAPPIEEPGIGFTVWEWFTTHGSQVGMVLAGLFGLLVLRGVVRGGGGNAPASVSEQEAFEQPMRIHEDQHEEEEGDPENPVSPKRKRKFAAGGPSLRDELADMVREDPDTAANILKSWITDAA